MFRYYEAKKINCDNSFLFCCYCCVFCSYIISSLSIRCNVYARCQKKIFSDFKYSSVCATALQLLLCQWKYSCNCSKSSPWLQCNGTKCPPYGRRLRKKYSLHAWSDEKKSDSPMLPINIARSLSTPSITEKKQYFSITALKFNLQGV